MSRTLRVSDQAKVDLLEIWCAISEDNMPAADRVIERLIAAYPMLLSMPLTGRNRSDIRADLRCHPMPPYVIFYSVSEKHVNILRVIHGSRHIEAVFEDEPIETFRIDE